MPLTIGQTIKKLRKERNLTQEELAEQLNVTFQAVSKWENETGLPDISQVVPLATVFGVSTDVLFGTYGTTDNEEAQKIIDEAYGLKGNGTTQELKRVYDALQNGLLRYPNNSRLLMCSLEMGITLAYPENDCYDKIHGKEIYHECIRQAGVFISISKNTTDTLRAHMIMVMLHSAYENYEKAREHAEKFPERSDMTWNVMEAYISHFEKNYEHEAYHCKWDILYHYEAMFCSIAQLGEAYRLLGKYDEALKQFEMIFSLINVIFVDEAIIPPKHFRECGDVHALIAHTYIDMGDNEKALERLGKMVDYDVNILPHFKSKDEWGEYSIKQRLLKKLDGKEFDSIRNSERFKNLIDRANSLED